MPHPDHKEPVRCCVKCVAKFQAIGQDGGGEQIPDVSSAVEEASAYARRSRLAKTLPGSTDGAVDMGGNPRFSSAAFEEVKGNLDIDQLRTLLQTKASEQEAVIASYKKQEAELKDTWADERTKMLSQIQQLVSERASSLTGSELESKMSAALRKVKSLEDDKANIEFVMSTQQSRIESTSKKVLEVEQLLREERERVEKLSADLEEAKGQHADIRARLDAREAEWSHIEMELRREIEDKGNQIEALLKKTKKLRKDSGSSSSSSSSSDSDPKKPKRKSKTAREVEGEELGGLQARFEQEKALLDEQLEGLTAANLVVQGEVLSLKETNSELRGQLGEFEAKLIKSKDKGKQLKVQVVDLKFALSEKEDSFSAQLAEKTLLVESAADLKSKEADVIYYKRIDFMQEEIDRISLELYNAKQQLQEAAGLSEVQAQESQSKMLALADEWGRIEIELKREIEDKGNQIAELQALRELKPKKRKNSGSSSSSSSSDSDSKKSKHKANSEQLQGELKDLIEQKTRLEHDKTKLEEDFAGLVASNLLVDGELATLKSENSDLQLKLEDFEAKLTKSKDKVKHLKVQVIDLKFAFSEKEEQLAQKTEEFESALSTSSAAEEDYKQQLSLKQEELNQVSFDLDNSKVQFEQSSSLLEAKLLESQTQMSKLAEEWSRIETEFKGDLEQKTISLGDLTTLYEASKTEAHELEQKLEEQMASVRELEGEITELMGAKDQSEQDKMQMKGEIDGLLAANLVVQGEVLSLKETNSELHGKLEEFEAKLTKSKDKVKQLKVQVIDLKFTLSEKEKLFESALSTSSAAEEDYKQQLSLKQEELNRVSLDLDNSKVQFEQSSSLFEGKLQESQTQMSTLAEEWSRIETELKRDLEQKTISLGDLTTLCEASKTEAHELEQKLEEQMASVSELEGELTELMGAKDQSEQDKMQMKGEIDGLLAANLVVQGEVLSLKETNSELRGQLGDFEAKLTKSKDKGKQLKVQVVDLKFALSEKEDSFSAQLAEKTLLVESAADLKSKESDVIYYKRIDFMQEEIDRISLELYNAKQQLQEAAGLSEAQAQESQSKMLALADEWGRIEIELKREIEDKGNQIAELQTLRELKPKKRKNSGSSSSSSSSDSDSKKSKHKANSERLQGELKDLIEQKTRLEHDKTNLQSELAALLTSSTVLQSKLTALSTENSDLQVKLDAFEAKLTKTKLKVKDLKVKLNDLQAVFNEKEVSLNSELAEKTELLTLYSKTAEVSDDYKQQLLLKQEEIDRITLELDDFRGQFFEASSQLARQMHESQHKLSDFEAERTQREQDLKRELDSKTVQIIQLQALLQETPSRPRKSSKSSSSSSSSSDSDSKGSKGKVSALKGKVSSLEGLLSELKEVNVRLEADKAGFQAEVGVLTTSSASAKAQQEELESQISALQAKLGEMQTSQSGFDQREIELKGKITELQGKVAALTEKESSWSAQLAEKTKLLEAAYARYSAEESKQPYNQDEIIVRKQAQKSQAAGLEAVQTVHEVTLKPKKAKGESSSHSKSHKAHDDPSKHASKSRKGSGSSSSSSSSSSGSEVKALKQELQAEKKKVEDFKTKLDESLRQQLPATSKSLAKASSSTLGEWDDKKRNVKDGSQPGCSGCRVF
jgi:chromosome segregation ATPase